MYLGLIHNPRLISSVKREKICDELLPLYSEKGITVFCAIVLSQDIFLAYFSVRAGHLMKNRGHRRTKELECRGRVSGKHGEIGC